MNNKSLEMEQFCESMSQKMFGRSRQDNVCVFCGSNKTKREDFLTELDWKEYNISKMCQKCITKTFG